MSQSESEQQLIAITQKVAKRLLCEGRPSEAIPAALQNLRCSLSVYGPNGVELALSYLMLAEASVGLKKAQQANNYIAQAEWLILQNADCPNYIRSCMFRTKGIIHATQRKFDEARQAFADDIYYASEEFGVNDIRTASGYFQLAKVFHELRKPEIAESLFDRVTDIWCDHLTKLVHVAICGQIVPEVEPYSHDKNKDIIEEQCLDEFEAAEATLALNMIYLVKNGPQYPDKVPKTSHCLAMLYFLKEDGVKAEEFGRLALYETEDLPYRRDAELFVKDYTEERKKQHMKMMQTSEHTETEDDTKEEFYDQCQPNSD